MKSNFTVFYSWQSDIKENRYFIQKCLDKAKKEIEQKGNFLNLEINIDKDTKDKSGSPSITETIFDKIDKSDIFICDVSIVNRTLCNKRISPNPNVLVELGYAAHLLSWDRIICINNLNNSQIEELPFDIRGHRISKYNSQNADCEKKLTELLVRAIKSIIENYDNILVEQSKNSYKKHDEKIYEQLIRLCSQAILDESISFAVNNLQTTKYYYDVWDSLGQFYESTINCFINNEIDGLMKKFLTELGKFNLICMAQFQPKDSEGFFTLTAEERNGENMTTEEIFKSKQSQIYAINKEPLGNETWEEAAVRVFEIQEQLNEQGEKVKINFKNLIMEIKRKILS